MNSLWSMESEICWRIVFALAHSFWQLLVLAGGCAVLVRAIDPRFSNTRYRIYLSTLLLMMLCLPLNFWCCDGNAVSNYGRGRAAATSPSVASAENQSVVGAVGNRLNQQMESSGTSELSATEWATKPDHSPTVYTTMLPTPSKS